MRDLSLRQSTISQEEQLLKQLLLSDELERLDKLHEGLTLVQDRVGDDDALQLSVRRVIVDALREAGNEHHERLSSILAPLVLASLREEIRNSRDMMAEALYPLIGRLVSTAVRRSFRELLEKLDTTMSHALSWSRLKLRAEAILTRRSYPELLLERFPVFEVGDTLVVHRSTGLLVLCIGEDTPGETGSPGMDSDLVGGMLSAIMSFTRDAFGEGDDEGSELSTLEFGESTLLIHSSPAFTMAVRTSGTAPASLDRRMDRAFVEFLNHWSGPLRVFEGELDPELTIEMESDLRSRLRAVVAGARTDGSPRRPVGKATVLLAVILLVFAGFQVKRGIAANEREGRDAVVASIEATARETIARDPATLGYPLEAHYDRDQDLLRVVGLVPGYDERDALRQELTQALPDMMLDYKELASEFRGVVIYTSAAKGDDVPLLFRTLARNILQVDG